MHNNFILSICSITYNHQEYISKALESFLMQKTDFDIEIVIGEDCSTDATREICLQYQKKHPDKIKLLLNNKNLGVIPNFIQSINACNGKYIAFCEGDDYWIDPLKLQKQVDYLEQNPDISLCFHNSIVLNENDAFPPHLFCRGFKKNIFNVKDLIKRWFIPSSSMVFRNHLVIKWPEWFENIKSGDYGLQFLLSKYGDFVYINEIMSIYNQTSTNLTSKYNYKEIKKNQVYLFNNLNYYFENKYVTQINKKIKHLNRSIKYRNILVFYNFLRNIKDFINTSYLQ